MNASDRGVWRVTQHVEDVRLDKARKCETFKHGSLSGLSGPMHGIRCLPQFYDTLQYYQVTKFVLPKTIFTLTPHISWVGSLSGWYCEVWFSHWHSKTLMQTLSLNFLTVQQLTVKAFMVGPKSAAGKCWCFEHWLTPVSPGYNPADTIRKRWWQQKNYMNSSLLHTSPEGRATPSHTNAGHTPRAEGLYVL